MKNCVDDESLSREERVRLLLQKVPRDLSAWRRGTVRPSIAKIRTLERHMRNLGVDQAPWREELREWRALLAVRKVMES